MTDLLHHRRVFLSYGHDDYRGFALMLKDDLEARGYHIWCDTNIRSGTYFDAAIEDGLRWVADDPAPGGFVLLMSPHSVRQRSYCLHELEYAFNRGLRIVPVLVAPCDLPLRVTRIQYVDMRDCAQRPCRDAPYPALLDDLVATIERGPSLSDECYDRYETPGVFASTPPESPPDFIDRSEQLVGVRQALGTPGYKVIVIVGPAGIGKTALAARLCAEIASSAPAETPAARIADRGTCLDGRQLADPAFNLLEGRLREMLPPRERDALWELERRGEPYELRLSEIVDHLSRRRYLVVLDYLEALLAPDGRLRVPEHRAFLRLFLTRHHSARLLAMSRRWLISDDAPGMICHYTLDCGLAADHAMTLLRRLDSTAGRRLSMAPREILEEAVRKTDGNPQLLQLVATVLERRRTLKPERLFRDEQLFRASVTGPLLKEAFALLTGEESHVMQAIAIYDEPVPLPAIAAVRAAWPPGPDLGETLDWLVRDLLIGYAEDSETFDMPNSYRDHIYQAIPEEGEVSRRCLHQLAAGYYAARLGQYEDEGRAKTSYERWYRFDQPDWQQVMAEWLHHLVLAGDREDTERSIAGVYFDAFWWWGDYQEFAMCDRVLTLARALPALSLGRDMLGLLETFHRVYPRKGEYRTRRGEHERWQTTRETLERLRQLLGLDVPLADIEAGDRRHLRAVTDIYLAEALHAQGAPAAEALYVEAHELVLAKDEDRWSAGWVLFELAEWYLDQGRMDLALATGRQALDEIEPQDHEARANVFRVLGDAHLQRGDATRAWQAYVLSIVYAFWFQGEPHPADLYTIAFYGEIVDRACARLAALAQHDLPAAEALCPAFYDWWAGYRVDTGDDLPPVTSGQLRAWLATGDACMLKAYLFPPPPEPDDEEYSRIAVETVATLGPRIQEWTEFAIHES